jgi:hypothetical protein
MRASFAKAGVCRHREAACQDLQRLCQVSGTDAPGLVLER